MTGKHKNKYKYTCIDQEKTQVENTILAGFKLNISEIDRIQNPAVYYQYFWVRENLDPNLKVKSEKWKENDEIGKFISKYLNFKFNLLVECPALISWEDKELLFEFESKILLNLIQRV